MGERMSDDWPRKTVGELCALVGSGVTPRGGNEVYVDSGVLFIRSQNVYSDGLRLDDVAHIPNRVHEEMRRSALQPYDVLYNITGASIGRCTYFPNGLGPANVNQHVCLLRIHDVEKRDAVYLARVLDSDIGRRQLRALNAGSNREGLNYQQLKSFEVPWPSAATRHRIAEIFDTIDETIHATERIIAKLAVAHEGLRRQLVPDRPGDGVEEVRLGDLIDPSRPMVYGILMPGDHVNGGVPVIKVKDIRGGAIADRRTLLHTSPQIDEQYARSRVREGDLLFTIRGTVGRMALVPSTLDGANITQDTARLAIDGVNRSFLLAAMTADPFSRFVDVHTIGQAVKGINLRELRQAPVFLLPRDQQEVVGAKLDDSLELIEAERKSLAKLRLLRSGVGADLLSGGVRTVTA